MAIEKVKMRIEKCKMSSRRGAQNGTAWRGFWASPAWMRMDASKRDVHE
jgi:hypothetical protein